MGRWYGEAHGVEELDGQIITKIHKVVLSKDWEEFYEQMIIEIWGEWTRFKKEEKKKGTGKDAGEIVTLVLIFTSVKGQPEADRLSP